VLTTSGGSDLWVPETTLDILDRAAATWPDATALVFDDTQITYAQYADKVSIVARNLLRMGAGSGRVAIVLRNSIDIAIAIFAVQAAGATSATLNPDYTPHELGPVLDQIQPAVTITHDNLRGMLQSVISPDSVITTVAELELTDIPNITLPTINPLSIAVMQFTGGTTGAPKGAMLSHRAVAMNVAQREAVLPTQAGDERIICLMPLYHSFAAAMCLHLTAYAGGALHIMPRYRPDWVLDIIERAAITRLPAGPTVFNSLLAFDGLKRARLASLRCAYSGSAPLAQDTLMRWEALTGVPIYEGYGQSEAGPVLTYHGPAMTLKQGSVGPPLPMTDIEIIGDADIGEIRARGPQIMSGYWNRSQETAATLIDGWLHTGDIGRIDADGYVFIEDRKKIWLLSAVTMSTLVRLMRC
jgi:long-chain acyl-CoA synthetase